WSACANGDALRKCGRVCGHEHRGHEGYSGTPHRPSAPIVKLRYPLIVRRGGGKPEDNKGETLSRKPSIHTTNHPYPQAGRAGGTPCTRRATAQHFVTHC